MENLRQRSVMSNSATRSSSHQRVPSEVFVRQHHQRRHSRQSSGSYRYATTPQLPMAGVLPRHVHRPDVYYQNALLQQSPLAGLPPAGVAPGPPLVEPVLSQPAYRLPTPTRRPHGRAESRSYSPDDLSLLGDLQPIQPLEMYHQGSEIFLRADGAIRMLSAMLGIPCVSVRVDEKHADLGRQLNLCQGGLLAKIYPIVVFMGRAYVQPVSIARFLAQHQGWYGEEENRDYYADAIMDSLRGWQEDQNLVISLSEAWLLSDSQDEPPQVLQGYLSGRPLYYDTIGHMFQSYQHLYRCLPLNVTWIDPLILAGIVDDIILDILLADRIAGVTTTYELIQKSNAVSFFNVMVYTAALRPITGEPVTERLEAATKHAQRKLNQENMSAPNSAAQTTAAAD